MRSFLSFFFCHTLLIAVVLFGCTKRGGTVDKLKMLAIAQKYDPTTKAIVPKEMGLGVRCKKDSGELIYGEGCVSGFLLQVGPLEMPMVEFRTEEQARAEALRLDQYYYHNWLFDDVVKEPILENFVKEAYEAKRATQNLDK